MDYVIIVHAAEEGGFWAEVPAPRVLHAGRSNGRDPRECQEAVELHIKVMTEDGTPLPDSDSIRVEKITVTAPSAA